MCVILTMDQWLNIAVAVGTICMAIGTLILAWITHKATTQSQKHNKENLEIMRKSYEPALSVELWKKTLKELNQLGERIYGVTVRNDGMGPAKNVKLTCLLWYMSTNTETGERWVKSDKGFIYGPTFNDIGNIAPRGRCKRRLGPLKNVPEGKELMYAILLQATCEDIFGNKNYEVKRKTHLEDAEELGE